MKTTAKYLTILISGLMILSLAGCSSGESSDSRSDPTPADNTQAGTESGQGQNNNSVSNETPQNEAADPEDLILVDSNYVLANGYVEYALEIQNPNESFAADFATITVTGKHADGSISFNDEWVVANLMPGSTTYWASQAGEGETTDSDTIDISVSVGNGKWSKTDQTLPKNLYTFDNVTVEPDKYERLTATGEITLNEEVTVGGYKTAENPMIVCILKDSNGKIVSGFNGYLNSDLQVGTSTAFDIDAFFEIPEYATAEMYANIW